MRSLAALLLMAAAPAFAQVVIDKPWARATAPGAKVAAGYMVVRNKATVADRLMSVTSPAAARVETHVHIHEAGVMKMREVPGYDIPAGGAFELKPGGAHLMFMDIRRPFIEGEKVPVKLTFEKAGEVNAEFDVGRISGGAPATHHKH
ncbi:MAG: copper chaperone PCu(A)C [Proteobacteria bacterium]|nr:copper chaperone PCu(A)C [Pseudomonadota bacterium]MDA0981507.1 copper chaperone PCu(A)C [Pseudomonadota bacterium]